MREPLSISPVRHHMTPHSCAEAERALEAGDYATVAEFIRTVVEQSMWGESDVSLPVLARWTDALPEPYASRPEVRLVQAWLLGERRQFTRALMLLEEMAAAEERAVAATGTGPTFWLLPARTAQGLVAEQAGRPDLARRAYAEVRRCLRALRPPQPANPLQPLELSPAEAQRLAAMDPTGAASILSDALDLFQALDDKPMLARVAHNVGHHYMECGEPAGARYWLERALELKRASHGQMSRLYTLVTLGHCYLELGLMEEARLVLEEALAAANQLGMTAIEGQVLCGLGDIARDLDEPETALEEYQKAATLHKEVNDAYGLAATCLSLSALYRRQGQFGLAGEYATEARALVKGHPDQLLQLRASLCGHIAAVLAGDVRAPAELKQTVAALAQAHRHREEALGRWYLAWAASRAGEADTARQLLSEALDGAVQWRHLHTLALELPVAGPLLRHLSWEGADREALAGLVRRATARGLSAVAEQSPQAAALVAAAGRSAHAMALTIHLLGTFQVTRGGRLLDLAAAHSQKAVALFKFLVAHRGRPCGREQILEALWPEADPASADRSFEVTLSTLRRLLETPCGPAAILRRGRGYLLNPDLPLTTDVECFALHLSRGDWWWQRGETGRAEQEYRQAEAAYKGDFLEEDLYEEWALADRERLREQHLEVLLRLGGIALGDGRYAEAVDRAGAVLAVDPVRETAYRLLMVAHARQGNRAVALRDYRRCGDVLGRELDALPMCETAELARRIRMGEPI